MWENVWDTPHSDRQASDWMSLFGAYLHQFLSIGHMHNICIICHFIGKSKCESLIAMLRRGKSGYFNDINLKRLTFELECVLVNIIFTIYMIYLTFSL